jgi:HAD superfamily hydrolase (TIGR01509 family)
VESRQVDLDSLIGGWREAFESAHSALTAGSHDLPADALRDWSHRLNDERAATSHLLEALARDRHAKRMLVRLVAAPWEAKRLLGLPSDVAACVFNLDGVLIGSAELHAEAWRETFGELLARRVDQLGVQYVPFSVRVDYPRHIHARPRLDGVREFLASRGITLPEGSESDPPGAETVHGIANRKRELLSQVLAEHGVSAYEGARLYLELAQDAGMRCGVVSASANAKTMLEQARLSRYVDVCIDGAIMLEEGLRRKPAPDTLLAACRRLGVEPGRSAVFETTVDGVDAARSGGFVAVVGVDQSGERRALQTHGADLTAADLGEIIERTIAG